MGTVNKKVNEFAVGLTVFMAFIVLIGGVIWGKQVEFGGKYKSYTVVFSEVYGLKEGSSVLVRGVNKGKVGSIRLLSSNAEVVLAIDKTIDIYPDADVVLFSPQLMGGRQITIDPGKTGTPLADGSVLQGVVPAGVGEVLAESGEVLENISGVILQLKTISSRIDSLFVESELVQQVKTSTDNFRFLSEDLRSNLTDASETMLYTSQRLRSTSDDLHEVVSGNREIMVSTLMELETIATTTKNVTERLDNITSAIQSEEGTVGKLVYSDSLHATLVTTLTSLEGLITKLKKEGVKVSIF